MDEVYLNNNGEEEEIGLIYRNGLFEIWGTTRTIDKSDYYVSVFLDCMMIDRYDDKNKCISARISIIKPEYIQYDRFLTKNEKDQFITCMNNNWNKVLDLLTWGYEVYNETVEYHGECPDYSLLPTLD